MFPRFLMVLGLVALSVAALPQEGMAASPQPMYTPPQQYYLSLGDSLAYGTQQYKAVPGVAESAFNTGYTNDFAAMLAHLRPTIQTVNLACDGATTTSFMSAPGCSSSNHPAHVSYSTSQFAAALAFLAAHPGQVSPITVSLGVDDVFQMISGCGGATAAAIPCVNQKLPATLQTVGTNLGQILGALRQAAPNSEIIVLQYYDPLAADPTLRSASNAAAQALNGVIATAAAATGARVADAFTPFNGVPDQTASICRLTLVCTAERDIHASDAGYAVIAQQFWNASGYSRMGGMFVVGFDSTAAGQGMVYFGSGPGCQGLVEVGTQDIHPGATTHAVVVTGNDLPGTAGDNGIVPGATYWYETVTVTSSGTQTDNNGGACYSVTIPPVQR